MNEGRSDRGRGKAGTEELVEERLSAAGADAAPCRRGSKGVASVTRGAVVDRVGVLVDDGDAARIGVGAVPDQSDLDWVCEALGV